MSTNQTLIFVTGSALLSVLNFYYLNQITKCDARTLNLGRSLILGILFALIAINLLFFMIDFRVFIYAEAFIFVI